MKKLQVFLFTLCLAAFGVLGTDILDVHAAVGDTFTAKIKNVPTGGTEQEIDAAFKVLKDPMNGQRGEVQVGMG